MCHSCTSCLQELRNTSICLPCSILVSMLGCMHLFREGLCVFTFNKRNTLKSSRCHCNSSLWLRFRSLVIFLWANLLIITVALMLSSQRTTQKQAHVFPPPTAFQFCTAYTGRHINKFCTIACAHA